MNISLMAVVVGRRMPYVVLHYRREIAGADRHRPPETAVLIPCGCRKNMTAKTGPVNAGGILLHHAEILDITSEGVRVLNAQDVDTVLGVAGDIPLREGRADAMLTVDVGFPQPESVRIAEIDRCRF